MFHVFIINVKPAAGIQTENKRCRWAYFVTFLDWARWVSPFCIDLLDSLCVRSKVRFLKMLYYSFKIHPQHHKHEVKYISSCFIGTISLCGCGSSCSSWEFFLSCSWSIFPNGLIINNYSSIKIVWFGVEGSYITLWMQTLPPAWCIIIR